MINLLQVLPVGNAIRVFVSPPPGTVRWRVLRRTADAFTGFDDAGALLVYQGESVEVAALDFEGLINGTLYWYKPYYWDGTAWTEAPAESTTPQSSFESGGVDVLSFVRDRISLGLKAEIARSRLTADRTGKIHCLNAPPQFDDSPWPVVTIHLDQDMPSERGLGEDLNDDQEVDAGWNVTEGWISRVDLTIVGWSLNPDQRIALRLALKRIIQANLPVFDAAGLAKIEFQQRDVDAVSGEYPAPVYQSMNSFSCLVPSYVTETVGAIEDIETIAHIFGE